MGGREALETKAHNQAKSWMSAGKILVTIFLDFKDFSLIANIHNHRTVDLAYYLPHDNFLYR